MSDTKQPNKKVLVSGCFDLLHTGHVTFFQTAAQFGDLYVCVGTDDNIRLLKGHDPLFSQQERLEMVRAVRYVKEAYLESGSGHLAFEPEFLSLKPDLLLVNEDGDKPAKAELCAKHNVQYKVLERLNKQHLPARSSTSIKNQMETKPKALPEPPYRICLAGGWIDQPWVSSIFPGSVVVINIHPTISFNERSGMATSTRNKWKGELWEKQVFSSSEEEIAKLLFGYENPPGSKYISGSQDALGLCLKGVNRLYYSGQFWPQKIDRCLDPDICDWLEKSIRLVEIDDRPDGYDPLTQQNLTKEGVERLARSGDQAWEAILEKDLVKLGRAVTATHKAWGEILPLTTSEAIEQKCALYESCSYGRITSGCGGGYIVLVTDQEVPGSLEIKIRK